MAVAMFNEKIFNPEVFGRYVETIPKLKRNELLKSGVLRDRSDLKAMFPEQTGGNYASIPLIGRIGGTPAKYDGQTDIPTSGMDTYSQSIIVSGFSQGWTEKDFTVSISGKNFMAEVAKQVSGFWEDFDQDTLIAVLKGVFSMTGDGNEDFVKNHTTDISGETGTVTFEGTTVPASNMGVTTLNSAIQKACGQNKGAFAMAIMHSAVATNLENLKLLTYARGVDADGIERDLTMATLNGKLILIDDSMPVESVAQSGDTPAYNKYTTFVLGRGAIDYADIGVSMPFEMSRDPKTNGGETTLWTRQRKLFAPWGISFTKTTMASLSPDLSELALGTNWELVNNGQSADKKFIDHKAVPIVRIISRG